MFNLKRRTLITIGLVAMSAAAQAQQSTIASKSPVVRKASLQSSAPVTLWPSKPIRMIVPWPAGTSADILARTIAEPLGKSLGQPIVVDNKPGASANIGADLLSKASDGHTIGVISTGPLTSSKLLNPKLPFDPIKDFTPISLLVTAPSVVVAANLPGNTPQELLVSARNLGNKLNFGSVGIGSSGHLGMELLSTKTNISGVHVPYAGNPAIINAMISGQVHMAMMPPGIALPQVKAGKVKLIGVSSAGRSLAASDLPTISEAGVNGFSFESWNALFAPAGMPQANVNKLLAEVQKIMKDPEIRQKIVLQGWDIAATAPEGLAYRIKKDTAMMGGVIAMRNIKIE
jgi:tripartite-type tricarboxylate transporter receptor subunit TctC